MMLGRSITKQTLTHTRSIHTTRPVLGFMDWLDFRKTQKKKEPKPAPTSEVIKKAEEGEIEVTKVQKIEFIGKDIDPRELLPISERLKGFQITHWLNKEKVNDPAQLDELLIATFQKITGKEVSSPSEIILDDLQLRFDYSVKIQEQTGYIIPDYVLTKASNASVLQEWFTKQVFTGKIFKKVPDSLSTQELKDFGFDSDNIHIHTPVSDGDAKKKYRKLLKKAKKEQAIKTEKLIEEARA